VGVLEVGDVNLTANGKSAYAGMYISSDYMERNAGIVVGDLNMVVNNVVDTATTNTATVSLSIDNYEGSITIGDINLSTAFLDAKDNKSFVAAYVNLDASDEDGDGNTANITIGDITVSGGDGIIDNFATLTGWLQLSADDDITIGTINYSGYGADADLDISGFTTVTAVIGSANDDTITVGKQTATQLTGGAGADTFVIDTTYDAKTLATIHKILDFSNAQGDMIDAGITPPDATEYGEGSYANFDAFLTSADAANKHIYVGLVGSDGFVAIDNNGDNTVDSVIMLVGLNSLGNIDLASFV